MQLYETSSRTIINLAEKNGQLTATLTTSDRPPEKCPQIERSAMNLHQHDVYVLDSTKSGPKQRTKETGLYGRILKPLFEGLFRVRHTYIGTTSSNSIHEFASSLNSNGKPVLVIIIAGDTSIGEFINSLSTGTIGDINIFVVPAGTGNSLALSLGIVDETTAVQRLLLHTLEDVSPLHLYHVQFPPNAYILDNMGNTSPLPDPMLFVVVASWAFHASLVADSDTEDMRRHGINRFKVAAHENLSRPQEYRGNVKITDNTENGELRIIRNGPFAYFVVTPSQRFEPTFEILPQGNIFDSTLYLISFRTEYNDDTYIMEIMKEVYKNGSHLSDKRVSYDEITKSMELILTLGRNESTHARRFCVDGAIVVVPDTENETLTVRYHGNKVHGWNLGIIS